ncbi:hypothetical protein LV78_003324 [Actinosynnema pretiosum]|nr:hypothetical protein [Actinosynnema pretiosum]
MAGRETSSSLGSALPGVPVNASRSVRRPRSALADRSCPPRSCCSDPLRRRASSPNAAQPAQIGFPEDRTPNDLVADFCGIAQVGEDHPPPRSSPDSRRDPCSRPTTSENNRPAPANPHRPAAAPHAARLLLPAPTRARRPALLGRCFRVARLLRPASPGRCSRIAWPLRLALPGYCFPHRPAPANPRCLTAASHAVRPLLPASPGCCFSRRLATAPSVVRLVLSRASGRCFPGRPALALRPARLLLFAPPAAAPGLPRCCSTTRVERGPPRCPLPSCPESRSPCEATPTPRTRHNRSRARLIPASAADLRADFRADLLAGS